MAADLTTEFDASKHLTWYGELPSMSGAKRIAEAITNAIDPLLSEGPPSQWQFFRSVR